MTILMLGLLFSLLFGLGVMGLLVTNSKLRSIYMKKFAFTVALGAVTLAAYGMFLVIIWPAG